MNLISFAPLAQGGDDFTRMLPLLAIIGAIFYFMVLRPERQKQSEQKKLLSGLKKNDRIVTIGGFIGTVVSTNGDSDEITIKLDESGTTRVRILRSAVQSVQTKSSGDVKDTDKGKDA